MLQFSQSARRAVLLLIAFAATAAGWEISARAGEKTLWAWHSGAQSSSDQFMVTFYAEVADPMPHYELDTLIDPLYLQFDHSELLYGIYYRNWYKGTREGFVSGVNYKAKYYLYDPESQSYNYLPGLDVDWTQE